MISCILLSGGASKRFGSPKALAKLHNTTVLEHLQKLLIKSKIGETIIVLGAHVKEIKPYVLKHSHIKLVYNKEHHFGQTSSFKAGLQSRSKNSQGIMLLPVDYPLVQLNTINDLICHFEKHHPLILVPSYKGKKGHPPIFSTDLSDKFIDLKNESGLNTIIHNHETKINILPVEDPGIISSFNTQEEFDCLIHPKTK